MPDEPDAPRATRKRGRPQGARFDPDLVRNISVKVYTARLGRDAAKMLGEVGEEKFSERAGAYDALTRAYLRAIGRMAR
jgi:hypothetical protein